MDFHALLLHHADELGLSREFGVQLHAALEPLRSSLGELMDLGIYFHNVTRCEAECDRLNLLVDAVFFYGTFVPHSAVRLRATLLLTVY